MFCLLHMISRVHEVNATFSVEPHYDIKNSCSSKHRRQLLNTLVTNIASITLSLKSILYVLLCGYVLDWRQFHFEQAFIRTDICVQLKTKQDVWLSVVLFILNSVDYFGPMDYERQRGLYPTCVWIGNRIHVGTVWETMTQKGRQGHLIWQNCREMQPIVLEGTWWTQLLGSHIHGRLPHSHNTQ